MFHHGADWAITALIIGAAISACVLGIAGAVSVALRMARPKESEQNNRRITRVLIFFTAAALASMVGLLLIELGAYVYGRVTGESNVELGDVPYVALALGLAIAPLLTGRLTRYARHWWVVAIALTLAVTMTVLMIYPA